MGTITEVFLPDLGDFSDVDVVEVLVKPGDKIQSEDSIISLESEKATMEIPSPYDGEVKEVKVSVGDKVSQGALILVMDVEEAAEQAEDVIDDEPAAAASAPPPMPPSEPAPAPAAEPAPRAYGEKEPQPRPVIATPADAPKGKAHASPAVRRFARELGVDLMRVPGTGSKGRITKDDVQNFVKQALSGGAGAPAAGGAPLNLPAAPEIDFSKFGDTETQPLGRIKKISGAHLHRSWITVPHVTQFDEADITELEAFRKGQKDAAAKQELKLTFMPFLLKAVAAALKEFPQFNS